MLDFSKFSYEDILKGESEKANKIIDRVVNNILTGSVTY
jgi:hypothetical protein